MDFKERRVKFLLDLLECVSLGEVTKLAGRSYDATGSVTTQIIVTNIDERPIEGNWKFYDNIGCGEEIYDVQIWLQGETRIIWWDPESGRYVEFHLREY